MDLLHFIWLVPVGFVVGALGTLIGAGGGFILVPLLILLYPEESPAFITSISLAVVFFNALSGSAAYARLGRIDYKSGLLFATATVPGSILGAVTTTVIPRRAFDLVFGLALIGLCIFIFARPKKKECDVATGTRWLFHRKITEKGGTTHEFAYNPLVGFLISLFVGYISSLLGIGGGIIHVPVLALLLNFPVHIATATSHFVLAIMALTGTAVHVVTGAFQRGAIITLMLAIGVLPGAQVGARISHRVQGAYIVRGLAMALGVVGIRIFWQGL